LEDCDKTSVCPMLTSGLCQDFAADRDQLREFLLTV
jgi:hypothetical protein